MPTFFLGGEGGVVKKKIAEEKKKIYERVHFRGVKKMVVKKIEWGGFSEH